MRDNCGVLRDFKMKCLTFGVKSSPYLATQVQRQLVGTHYCTHPEAAKAIQEDFYVDDFLSGAETVEEANTLRLQLCDLLLQAGMNLRTHREEGFSAHSSRRETQGSWSSLECKNRHALHFHSYCYHHGESNQEYYSLRHCEGF